MSMRSGKKLNNPECANNKHGIQKLIISYKKQIYFNNL